MNLVIINLSNELAMNNSVYLSNQLAKDPSKVVIVRIDRKLFKCSFTAEVEKGKIGMSKNIRQYIGTDVGKTIKVEPVDLSENQQTGLSYLELELTQVLPKVQPGSKINVEDYKIIQSLRAKEASYFFNYLECKYVKANDILYSVKATKCYLILTGEQKKSQPLNQSGRLVSETQVELKVPNGSPLQLESKQSVSSNIFRPDFKIQDMGIGGLDQQLFNIFRRTFASRRYSTSTIKKFGIKHVRGILLYGPPGTGKTLIARQLAKALNVKDLKIVNGPEIFSKFVGQSEQNIRKLFAQARQDQTKLGDKSPLHIIVFDQIDAICKQRGMNAGVGSQVSDMVVNQILTNIDGVEALNNIIVIGMTNRKDLLDEAILRPGRFEVHIEINLPNVEGRVQILNIHTKNLRNNKLLDPNCKIQQLARLTKNFTGAQIEALVKCASSHSISRTTNILDFSKELIIDEKNLKVEMQDFLKALQEVKPQFGVDEQKFGSYFREKVINYGPSFDKIMSNLQESTIMKDNIVNQKKSVLIYGKPGTGKTMLAINYARHTSFAYLKIISPENYVGMTDSQKIHAISKIFQNAYRTTSACIVIDNLERLIDYCAIGKRFSNNMLQALLLLLEKAPPKESCKLLIIGTTSCYYQLDQIDLSSRFDIRLQAKTLAKDEIQYLLKEKYSINDDLSKKIGALVDGCTIKNLLQLADLIDTKNSYSEWEFYWQNLLNAKQEQQQQIQIQME